MRSVFVRSRTAAAVLLLFVFVIAPIALADGEPSPFDPPQSRVRPPIGSDARIQPPTGVITDARIRPPTGVESRVGPPIGVPEPSLIDLLRAWLEQQLGVR